MPHHDEGGHGATGVSNQVYDLVSVLYHALQGGTTYAKYQQDAGGNQELAQFFQQCQEQDRQRAQQAQQLLGRLLSQGGGQ